MAKSFANILKEFDWNIELHQNVCWTSRHPFLNETVRPKAFIPKPNLVLSRLFYQDIMSAQKAVAAGGQIIRKYQFYAAGAA